MKPLEFYRVRQTLHFPIHRMTRRKPPDEPPPSAPAPSFEEALGELEEIVQAMDAERLPLEELLAKYERGHQLLQLCQGQIDSAQQRIDLITTGRGGATLQSFAAAAESPGRAAASSRSSSSNPSTPPTEEDDIRLF